jgi:outer membrane protein assembly factor BamB
MSRRFAVGLLLILAAAWPCGCGKRDAAAPATASASTAAAARVNPDWPIFRGDAALTGVAAADLPDTLGPAWNTSLGGEIKSSPVIGGGRVFIGSTTGTLHALDLADGHQLWQYAADAPIEAPPLLVDGTVHVGDGNGVLHAVSAADGAFRWKFTAGQTISGSANFAELIDGKKLVLFGSYDANLRAVDAATGQEVWRHRTKGFINGAPAVADGRVVFGGCDAFLRFLSLADGTRTGQVDVGAYLPSSPALRAGRAYAGHYDNALVCIDVARSAVVWEFRDRDHSAPFFAPPAVTADIVVVGARNGRVYGLVPADGTLRWLFQTQGDVDAGPVICGDKVVVASRDGHLYLLRLADGTEVWSADIGSAIASSPAVANGMIVFGADDGRVYAYR